jgi:hypothetical protein
MSNKQCMASRLKLLNHPDKSPQPRGRHHKNVGQQTKQFDMQRYIFAKIVSPTLMLIAFGCSSLGSAIAGSLSGVTPEQVGEPFDLPPSEAPTLKLPSGSTNLAYGRSITTNFPDPIMGQLDMITDGNKGVLTYSDGRLRYIDADNCYVEFSPSIHSMSGDEFTKLGPRFVQFDFQESNFFDAIWIWAGYRDHGYDVVRKLVIQISQDPKFATNPTTVFNCDTDNSLGFGLGSDRPFASSRFGKLIRIKPTLGRYVRIWCNGSVMFPRETRLVEIEIYGRPVGLNQRNDARRVHKADQPNAHSTLYQIYLCCGLFGTATMILVRLLRKNRKATVQPPEE